MIAAEPRVFDAELSLGYEAALAQTRRYWRTITACAARIEVPEPAINDCIRQSVRFSNLLTEKNPATGKYCKVNGSWTYADLWTTPGSMDLVMLLDTLGYHRTVDRYLNILLEEQGTVKPPGPAYGLHRGYFSTPELYKSIDWLSDNGAVLYTLAIHGLLTGDRDFIAQSTQSIIRSCEWIAESRRKKNHGGYDGVLPPAVRDMLPAFHGLIRVLLDISERRLRGLLVALDRRSPEQAGTTSTSRTSSRLAGQSPTSTTRGPSSAARWWTRERWPRSWTAAWRCRRSTKC